MEKIIDAKKELMIKINIGDVVIHSKIDGKVLRRGPRPS